MSPPRWRVDICNLHVDVRGVIGYEWGIVKFLIRVVLAAPLLAGFNGLAGVVPKPAVIKVSAQTFTAPAKWKSTPTASRMRAAQFAVPGKEKADAAECVFFYFGPGQSGGAQANLQRWVGQFAPNPKPLVKTENAKFGSTPVVFLFAEGTFMSSPPFGGAKVPKENYGMAAAVLGTEPGYIFVKMTGPKATVEAAKADFKKMIESGLKK